MAKNRPPLSKSKRRRPKPRHDVGAPPGTLPATQEGTKAALRLLAWDGETLVDTPMPAVDALDHLAAGLRVRWVDIDGVADVETLKAVGRRFGLHPLALEDVAHRSQRAKVDVYQDHLFITAHMYAGVGDHQPEEVSLFVGRDYVLTFQGDQPGDSFGHVRERVRTAGGRVRLHGADYLAYALIDAMVDQYFPILDHCDETLDTLEDRLVSGQDGDIVSKLLQLRTELLGLRRHVRPLRDVMARLLRDDTPIITADTRVYLTDCADHVTRISEALETALEHAISLMNFHVSLMSNRLNQAMRTLTIISTIFIPLSFIAGVYGMNFKYMPELTQWWGYPMALGTMAAVAGGFVYFFRRLGWLGGRTQGD